MTLPPLEVTLDRIGDRARPANGRPPVARYTFAACSLDAIEDARARLTLALERTVGPLRCTPVDVTVAVGKQDAAELLEHLARDKGQTVETLQPVAVAVGQVSAQCLRLGLDGPALVVATCGALTGQARAAVWAS